MNAARYSFASKCLATFVTVFLATAALTAGASSDPTDEPDNLAELCKFEEGDGYPSLYHEDSAEHYAACLIDRK